MLEFCFDQTIGIRLEKQPTGEKGNPEMKVAIVGSHVQDECQSDTMLTSLEAPESAAIGIKEGMGNAC